jgi:hypothetical protein
MADLIDEEMASGRCLKDGNMQRLTGGMKSSSGGGRKRVHEDV